MRDLDQVNGETAVAVIAMVCSAGGLDALTTVLGGLPAGLPSALVIQQHIGAGSMLAPLLKRRTGLPAEWAFDQGSIHGGDVLVCPPQHSIELLPDGRYRLRPADGRARSLAHDGLLASLASVYGRRGVAVVLSGMGSDGAAGTALMLKAGGITLAQSEASAAWPSMPRAAAAAGALLIFPLDQVAGVLAGITRGESPPRTDTETAALLVTFGSRTRMGALARGTDWSRHPLGPAHHWTASVRQALRLVSDFPVPALLLVGDERFTFGNDAAVSLLGSRAEALGVPSRQPDQWPGFTCGPVRDEDGVVIASLYLALGRGQTEGSADG